ncbi:MAG: aerobic carbon-monoxide dehydrogenase medium subunit [Alphaproteobacteria bacterium]|nr:aerobic carbon-monoxide dehydrogenase medium subunit [Alphaproteobacteria bacterium]
MKPAIFEFVRARTLSEATKILLESDGAARVVAGAQSLGPMLNLRLVQPRILVDVTGIAELTEIDDRADAVTLGACITTANIEDGRLPGRGLQPLSVVAERIAYRRCATAAPSVAASAMPIRPRTGSRPSARSARNV